MLVRQPPAKSARRRAAQQPVPREQGGEQRPCFRPVPCGITPKVSSGDAAQEDEEGHRGHRLEAASGSGTAGRYLGAQNGLSMLLI